MERPLPRTTARRWWSRVVAALPPPAAGAALWAGGSQGRRRQRESARAFHLPQKTFQAGDPVSRDSEVSRCETQISKWARACAPPPPSRRSGAVGRRWGPTGLRGLPRGGALVWRVESWGPRTRRFGRDRGRGDLARFPRGPANLAHTEVVGGNVQQRRRGRGPGSGVGVDITGRWPRTWPW